MIDRRSEDKTVNNNRRKANRRAFPRWRAGFEVEYAEDRFFVPTQGCEIGEGGLSFACCANIPLGTELSISYRLPPSEKWVKLKAIVKHLNGERIGVEFLNLRLNDRLAITRFVTLLQQPANASTHAQAMRTTPE